MFNPDFTDADAVPILARQNELALASVNSALETYPAKDSQLNQWLSHQRDLLHGNPQHIHEPFFLSTLENYATALSRSGEHQAAITWGRAAYIAGRRFAHGWFGLLDIAISAGVIKTIAAQPPQQGPIHDSGAYIPRRLMQFWDKPIPPADVTALMDRMRTVNKEWFYHRIDEARAASFLSLYFGGRTLNAFNALSHVAARSDLFRACWLYQRGGVYIDADEDCVGTIEQLLPAKSKFILSWTSGSPSCVNNWFVATAPANILLKKIIQIAICQIEESNRRAIKLNAWILTGPGVYTMACLDTLSTNEPNNAIQDLQLIGEAEYRRIVRSPESLAYRADPRSNWRLEQLG